MLMLNPLLLQHLEEHDNDSSTSSMSKDEGDSIFCMDRATKGAQEESIAIHHDAIAPTIATKIPLLCQYVSLHWSWLLIPCAVSVLLLLPLLLLRLLIQDETVVTITSLTTGAVEMILASLLLMMMMMMMMMLHHRWQWPAKMPRLDHRTSSSLHKSATMQNMHMHIDDDDPITRLMLDVADRVKQSRCEVMRWLGSVGSPPLTSSLSGSYASKNAVRVTQNHNIYDSALFMLFLTALERFVMEHVSLIQQVEDCLEWIEAATAMRIFGASRITGPCGSLSPRHISSMERLETSWISRLNQPTDPSNRCYKYKQLPRSPLRRNLAMVLLMQHKVVIKIIQHMENVREGDTTQEEKEHGESDDGIVVEPASVVTLAWLRSLRTDLVHRIHSVTDVAYQWLSRQDDDDDDDSMKNDQTVLLKRAMMGLMDRASTRAQEARAYLQVYPSHAELIRGENSNNNDDENQHEYSHNEHVQPDSFDPQIQLIPLSLALVTTVSTLHENIIHAPRCNDNEFDENQWYLSRIRDLSSHIADAVKSLDSALASMGPPLPLPIISVNHEESSSDPSLNMNTNQQTEMHLASDISSQDGRNIDSLTDPYSQDYSASRLSNVTPEILIYSGRGQAEESTRRNTSPEQKKAWKGLRPASSTRSNLVPEMDSSMLHHTLLQELQDRLISMIRLDEVNAQSNSSIQHLINDEEDESITGIFRHSASLELDWKRSKDDSFLQKTRKPEVPNSFLMELRGAMDTVTATPTDQFEHCIATIIGSADSKTTDAEIILLS